MYCVFLHSSHQSNQTIFFLPSFKGLSWALHWIGCIHGNNTHGNHISIMPTELSKWLKHCRASQWLRQDAGIDQWARSTLWIQIGAYLSPINCTLTLYATKKMKRTLLIQHIFYILHLFKKKQPTSHLKWNNFTEKDICKSIQTTDCILAASKCWNGKKRTPFI